MTLIERVEDCVKWYWQGFDAFAKMDVPVCPYVDGEAKRQWWLGYDDAENEHSQSLDVVCERCNGTHEEDSGGVYPWGEGINVRCQCQEGNL